MRRSRKHLCLGGGGYRDGARRTCRDCRAAYSRKYRAMDAHKEKNQAYWKKIQHSPAASAKTKVFCAVRSGQLPRPTQFSCKDCGAPAQVYAHPDYAQPLQVEPVCRPCLKKRPPGKNKSPNPEALARILAALTSSNS